MIQTTGTGSKVIRTFGLSEKHHRIVCDRIDHGIYGDITHDGCFLTMPDRILINKWIDQSGDNASFLKNALNDNATIYTLYESVIGKGSHPIGDVAVYDIK